MLLRSLLLWLPMIFIAFGNAAFRQLFLIKHLSDLRAHQLSTILLTILCAIYVWLIYPFLKIQNAKHALATGAVWVVLTFIFETALGTRTNRTARDLFADYNILAGRVWVLFLTALFFLPFLVHILKGK